MQSLPSEDECAENLIINQARLEDTLTLTTQAENEAKQMVEYWRIALLLKQGKINGIANEDEEVSQIVARRELTLPEKLILARKLRFLFK